MSVKKSEYHIFSLLKRFSIERLQRCLWYKIGLITILFLEFYKTKTTKNICRTHCHQKTIHRISKIKFKIIQISLLKMHTQNIHHRLLCHFFSNSDVLLKCVYVYMRLPKPSVSNFICVLLFPSYTIMNGWYCARVIIIQRVQKQ